MEGGNSNFLLPTLLGAVTLAAVHLFAGKLRFLQGIPRSRWLSIAGGVSVAYVFVHMLPELSERQDEIGRIADGLGSLPIEYLFALVGLVFFYGLERMVLASPKKDDKPPPGIFWVHLSSFAVYNAIVGELLSRRAEEGTVVLINFAIAMALHFVVNDYGLREHHKDRYTCIGRWILAVAVLVGWAIGRLELLSATIIYTMFAVLAGGVVLNVLKEELPEERKSRFGAFLIGCVSYAALVLVGV